MEIHRLKPMQKSYNKDLFNKYYRETEDLREKLAYQINPRRYGVSHDIIKSWFDDKFIFIFNKYYGIIDDNTLKGYIINGLKTFKYRVLRKAYEENNIFNHQINLEDIENFDYIIKSPDEPNGKDIFLEMALKFLKKNLCEDAFFLLELELNPPPYIINRLITSNKKIPNKLFTEYLGLENNYTSNNYIRDLRNEIKYWVKEAQIYFN